jgi:aspartokinase
MWLRLGAISYEKAKELAILHLEALNEMAAKIAKKHGIKPRKITFSAFMR